MKKHIVVVTGSVRPESYTSKALALVLDELKKHDLDVSLLDAPELKLYLPGQVQDDSSHEKMQETVKGATALILISPEYHGGISSPMKLIIDNLGFPSALAGKPTALLGVAAGSIGAVKSLEQLRSICSHVGATVLPRVTSIANIQEVFDSSGQCQNTTLEDQMRSVVTMTIDYLDQHVYPLLAYENMVREGKCRDL